jgi:hypothetical protein
VVDRYRLEGTCCFSVKRVRGRSKQTNKLHGLSPQANYTDQATAAYWKSWCQLLQIQGVAWSVQQIPTAVFSIFYAAAATISSKKLLNCTHEAEWTPFQTHYFSVNLVAPGIEPGPLDLQPENRRSRFLQNVSTYLPTIWHHIAV